MYTCKTDRAMYEINNLNNNYIAAFGHGGMGISYKYPLNSDESLKKCIEVGADGTEMDVQITKDSVLVAFHSNNLNETTSCEGKICDKNWNEIASCKYNWPVTHQMEIITLDNLMNTFSNHDKIIYTFDCKLYRSTPEPTAYNKQFANAILSLMAKNNLNENNVFIESKDTSFLSILKNKNKALKLFYYPLSFQDGLNIAKTMGLFGISISNDDITKEEVDIAHDNGIRITLWNTKTKNENIDAILKNPDYIQTDKINHLLKVFDRYHQN